MCGRGVHIEYMAPPVHLPPPRSHKKNNEVRPSTLVQAARPGTLVQPGQPNTLVQAVSSGTLIQPVRPPQSQTLGLSKTLVNKVGLDRGFLDIIPRGPAKKGSSKP